MFIFDESPVLAATVDELDTGLLMAALGKAEGIEREQLLLNKRITLRDVEGVGRPTVAGLLCFSKKPHEHLKSAHIHAAVYRRVRRHSNDLVHLEDGADVNDYLAVFKEAIMKEINTGNRVKI